MFKEVKYKDKECMLIDSLEGLQAYFKIRSDFVAKVMEQLYTKINKNSTVPIKKQISDNLYIVRGQSHTLYTLVYKELVKGNYDDFDILNAVHTEYTKDILDLYAYIRNNQYIVVSKEGDYKVCNEGDFTVLNSNQSEILTKYKK